MNDAEILSYLCAGWKIRMTDQELYRYILEPPEREIDRAILERLFAEGWLVPGNQCFWITEDGRKAYIKSTDELGDGKLIPPRSLR